MNVFLPILLKLCFPQFLVRKLQGYKAIYAHFPSLLAPTPKIKSSICRSRLLSFTPNEFEKCHFVASFRIGAVMAPFETGRAREGRRKKKGTNRHSARYQTFFSLDKVSFRIPVHIFLSIHGSQLHVKFRLSMKALSKVPFSYL